MRGKTAGAVLLLAVLWPVCLAGCGDVVTVQQNNYYASAPSDETAVPAAGTGSEASGQSAPTAAVPETEDVPGTAAPPSPQEEEGTPDGKVHYFIKDVSGTLNLRAEPSHNSALVGTVDDDYATFLSFLGRTGRGPGSDEAEHTWYQVQTCGDGNGVSGWVRSDLVREIDYDAESSDGHPTYTKISDGGLNVRSQPKHDSALVCTVTSTQTQMYPLGPIQSGLGSDDQLHDWAQISVERDLDRVGWVRMDLTDAGFIGTGFDVLVKNVDGKLNVRSEPRHDSALVASIENNDTYLFFLDQTETGYGSDNKLHDWYLVEINGARTGWVRSDLVKVLY